MTKYTRYIVFAIFLNFGCKPLFNTELNEISQRKINKQFEEVTDLFLLGNLIMEYHEKNSKWPTQLSEITFSNDSLKLFLTIFDEVYLNLSRDSLQVKYKFAEKRKIMIPIEFIKSESVTNEAKTRTWKNLDNAKYIKEDFDGLLLFYIKNDEYHVFKDPALK